MRAELLAPAGSFETMVAAFRAGADAVYLGGEKFGARAYARNLDQEQMLQAIDYAHLYGKKLYLTVNTVLKGRELEEELYGYLAPFYEAGLDAVIVQDMGVLSFVRKEFPDLPIHASTQMTVSGVESALLLKKAGVTRIVTPRELSLEEIRAMYEATGLEIESFIHGALCYCYSGQCLMSSLIGGRSGNRGRCAQPCRLPYQVYRDGKRLNNEKTAYPLSPKDMCTVRILPQIIRSGVYSLKIEGRMKKTEYAAGVVEIYRKYLDRFLAGEENPRVAKEDMQQLMDIYNRDGFHESYYQMRNGRQMMALRNEKKTEKGKDIVNARNEALFKRLHRDYLEGKETIKIKGNLSLFFKSPAILEVEKDGVAVTVYGNEVQMAQKRPLLQEDAERQMRKTGATAFAFGQLDIRMDDHIFFPVQQLNELRREALNRLQEALLEPYRRKLQTPDHPAVSEKDAPVSLEMNQQPEHLEIMERFVDKNVAAPFLSASVCTWEQWEAIKDIPEISRVYLDCAMFPADHFAEEVESFLVKEKDRGKTIGLMLPHMVRDRELNGRKEAFPYLVQRGLGDFLVRNLESYGILKSQKLSSLARLDANLYTANGESQEFWSHEGIAGDTVPLELNRKELTHRRNQNSEMIVYGYLPMMVSVQCLQKNLDRCNHQCAVLTVKDRQQKEFHAVCNCEFCYNTIYNTVPLSLLKEADQVKRLGVGGVRLSFTLESKKEARKAAEIFAAVYIRGDDPKSLPKEVTKGHFQRGVE